MIALLFGSFNPIHKGHLAIAQYTLDRQLAKEIWFVVTPQNPLKSEQELAPFLDRLEMVRIATVDKVSMKVCDIEGQLPKPSYTVNTLRALRSQHPDDKFLILAGSDIAQQLPRWRESDEVKRLASFLIYPRGQQATHCSSDGQPVTHCSPEMVDAPRIDIDSTTCRAGLYPLSEAARNALPSAVIEYINQHKLYTMTTIEEYNTLIATSPESDTYHLERGDLHYHQGNFGEALNDFNTALELNPENIRAQQMKNMTEAIFDFHHSDIYNP